MRTILKLIPVAVWATVVFAQTPSQTPAGAPTAPLTFEVASIKIAEPITPAKIQAGQLHVGMNVMASRVDIGYMSIADLIRTAYKVKTYQVSGPDWINTQRFDILAKMPEGATKEQAPEMLQALLAERFKLILHHESKEHSTYALVVGKGGLKMKEAPPDPVASAGAPADAAADPPAAKGAGAGMTFGSGSNQVRVVQSKDGMGSTTTGTAMGTTKTTVTPEGTIHMEVEKMPMEGFAEMLSRFVDRPVLDMTELKGNYQVTLDLPMADVMAMASKVTGGAIAGPGTGGDAAHAAVGTASDPTGGSIFNSVQKLGLKLEPRKGPVDVLVVDHVEKLPTDN